MTEAELQTITIEAEAVHEYRPNPVSVGYDAGRKRVILTYADDSEHSFPIVNVEVIARLPHTPTDAELSDMTLTGGGWTIRWSALDVYLPVDDAQECIYGSQQWMSQLLKASGQR